jgi:ABC-type bacteriocin/lantibiotic exporter with double-glycine peptidase domain
MRILFIAACVLPQAAALVGIRPSPATRRSAAASIAATAVAAGKSDDEIKAAPRASKAQWAQLRELVRKDWPLLGAASVALTAAALADVAVPHYSSGALTAVVAKDSTRVRAQLWGLSMASLASAAFTGVRGGLFWLAGTRVVTRLRLALFGAMLRQDIAFFDATSTGELASRLSGDAAKVSDVVYDLGVPRCCGAFTPSTRVVSRRGGCSDRFQ